MTGGCPTISAALLHPDTELIKSARLRPLRKRQVMSLAAMAAPRPLIVSPLTHIDHLTSQPGLRPAAHRVAEAPGPPDKAGGGAS